ncbi:amidase [Phenylobacterium sp. 20VBR1]|uniref:Amidase n=1 Tax=Phenylobacterium glaciei TaxID=2803784 RepID=A0A941D3M3_9CAUL|nr:amidase [Phenylobacterium glaciei]MBR7620291.1 amidase [Phenylobacterium glaciei]
MKFEEYRQHDAVALAGLVAKGEVSAGELLETAVERMAQVNPALNAVTLDLTDFGRAEAGAKSSGPLAGVPFLLKDLGALLGGTVTSSGSALLKDNVAAADSAITKAYRDAGLVIFGKTNTPEFGLMPITESTFLGPCRNPWDVSRTPGGSSGGAASAVAAGIVPAAHASDGGGSIRTPASACGLFGMKPSRGRVSFAPLGEGWGGASIQHAVTRSVRDSAVLLDIVCQPQVGDPYFLAAPSRPYAQEVGRAPGSLRIGFTTAALASDALDPECAAAVLDAAKLCASLGHTVEEVTLPGDLAAMQQGAGDVIAASIASIFDTEAERRGRPVTEDDVEVLTWGMYRRGTGVSGSSYVRGLAAIHAYGRAVAAMFETYDVVLLSTLGSPAIPIGHLTEDLRQFSERLFAFMPNTQAFNNTGQPAMTVPLAWSKGDLPIGLQFVGRMGDEATLFRLAGQLETAQPWFDRVAPL